MHQRVISKFEGVEMTTPRTKWQSKSGRIVALSLIQRANTSAFSRKPPPATRWRGRSTSSWQGILNANIVSLKIVNLRIVREREREIRHPNAHHVKISRFIDDLTRSTFAKMTSVFIGVPSAINHPHSRATR